MSDWWVYQNHTPPQVHDNEEIDTGLLHHSGAKIVRLPIRPGFTSSLEPQFMLQKSRETK